MQNKIKKSHILIVDDDNRILDLLKKYLIKNEFLVSTAPSVMEAENLMKCFIFDLIILDVMLPNITGLEFARTLRNDVHNTPILMLTALSEVNDRITGYEAGANDYLSKPFDPRELLVRVNNLLNLYHKNQEEKTIQRFGNYFFNLQTKQLFHDNQNIKLSSTEQDLLYILINQANSSITREDLSEHMGGLNLRSIDVQIARIRNKIEPDSKSPQHIKTIRNKGYAFFL